jgi:GxxExxY protein
MPYGDATSAEIERVATAVVDACFVVHKRLGPGLLESVYKACLTAELRKRGFTVVREMKVPIFYDGIELDEGFRLDLLINDLVIVEAKAVEKMIPVFDAQILTHLRLTNRRLGFLVNFNVPLIKDGIKRVIN